MEFVTIGKIINIRGLQGEVKLASLTDFPLLRYQPGKTVYLEGKPKQPYLPLVVKSYHHHRGFDYVQFKGFDRIELVQPWMNCYLYADKHEIRLQPGHYFYADLIGLKVIDQHGMTVGTVKVIETIGNRPLLRMQRKDLREILIPFIHPFIVKVDVSSQTIAVKFVEGMLE
jgi:16S rRNA processing protein RimM